MAQLFRDQGRDAWNESKLEPVQAVLRVLRICEHSIRERLAL